MKLFVMIFILGFQSVTGELEKTCFIPATCTSPTSKYITAEWMQFSPSAQGCKANAEIGGDVGVKGEIGAVGPKGAVGPVGLNGEIGPVGRKGELGTAGRNGEIGPIGPKGENGTNGDTGSIDNSTIKMMQNDTSALQQKFKNLKKRVDDFIECRSGNEELLHRIEALEKTLNYTTTQAQCENTTIECDDGIAYNGSCYFTFLYPTQNISYAEGESICNATGGRIGEIWSVQHQTLIENDLLVKLQNFELPAQPIVWLSMTYNDSMQTLTMPNAYSFPSTTLRWYSTYPTSNDGYTAVMIGVSRNQTYPFRGLINNPDGHCHGVLCVK